jgi:hypothetical protein
MAAGGPLPLPAAVWTGHQLLVWGGHSRIPNQGLRPCVTGPPTIRRATAGSRSQRPAGVQGTSIAAVWTGSRMLVWVGNAPDGRPSAPAMTRPGAAGGGSPQPARTAGVLQRGVDRRGVARVRRQQRGRAPDTRRSRLPAGHRPLAGPAAAPVATRVDHAAVWTGRELLVWGGRDARHNLADGAAYEPRLNRWRPIAGRAGAAVAAAVRDPDAGLGRRDGQGHQRALYDRWVTAGPRSGQGRPWLPTAPDRCGPAPS